VNSVNRLFAVLIFRINCELRDLLCLFSYQVPRNGVADEEQRGSKQPHLRKFEHRNHL